MEQIPFILGGLALFLYGMDQMGKGLELLAGNKLQGILQRLTRNKYMGVLVGIFVTAIIQSSSATTVMTVGFVNSKILNLSQAISIIIGANIGTTITGILLTLDIEVIAPIIAFAGMVLQLFSKKRKRRYIGTILFGFGTLFIGMNFMGDAVKPLANSPGFINVLTKADNPLVAVVIGALFTAVIQSSSATTGILITLANGNLLSFSSAFYLVLGQNIGTCITSFIASMGSNKNAKRAAITHVNFNFIGTIIFMIFSFFLPIVDWISGLTPDVGKQIAFLHTIFNLTTSILLLPFTEQLVNLSKLIIKGEDPSDMDMRLLYLNKEFYKEPIISIANIRQETIRMLECSKESFKLAIDNLMEHNEDKAAQIKYQEELLDFLQTEITKASVKTMTNNMSKTQYKQLSYFLKIASNIERLGDYAYNISLLSDQLSDKNLTFSPKGYEEIVRSVIEVNKLYDKVIVALKEDNFDMKDIRSTGFKIQDHIEHHKDNYVYRMQNGEVDPESGLIYEKFYSYLTRLRDHLLNVANQYSTIYK